LIPQGSKETVIEAIDTAVRAGARQTRACEIVGITPRTLQNWHRGGTEDKRKGAQKNRIAVEGTFGRAKRRYSMGRLMTKLAQTSETQVAVIMLVMNLEKIRKNLFCVFILAMIVGRKTPKSHFPGGLGYSKMAA
jgi:transposase-like protein